MTHPCFGFLYNFPISNKDIHFSAKGISFKWNTINILGKYLLAFEFISCTAKEPSASIKPARYPPYLLRKYSNLFSSLFDTNVLKVCWFAMILPKPPIKAGSR